VPRLPRRGARSVGAQAGGRPHLMERTGVCRGARAGQRDVACAPVWVRGWQRPRRRPGGVRRQVRQGVVRTPSALQRRADGAQADITLEAVFPASYPADGPVIRVVRPRFVPGSDPVRGLALCRAATDVRRPLRAGQHQRRGVAGRADRRALGPRPAHAVPAAAAARAPDGRRRPRRPAGRQGVPAPHRARRVCLRRAAACVAC
jgi:hypothetical protein